MKPLAIRNILVATDLSEEMAPALQSASELAELSGARLHIVHATEQVADRRHTDQKLTRLQVLLGRELDVSILAGPAAAVITEEAIRTQADVIVLGRHRNIAGHPGSTADRVVRTAHVSCLILSQPITMPLASVLVPVDVANAAGPLAVALTWASALRRRHPENPAEQTCVNVLHVQSDNNSDGHELESRLEAEVTSIKQRIAQFAGVRIEQHLERSRDVPSSICEQTETMDAALLVLGTRAQRIESDPLGSVSSAVAQRVTRPLLLVPPEVWRAAAQQIP